MALEVLLIGGLAAVLAVAVAMYLPGVAFTIIWGRRLIFGAIGILSGLILIGLGGPEAQAAGFLVLFFIFLVLAYERPQEKIW